MIMIVFVKLGVGPTQITFKLDSVKATSWIEYLVEWFFIAMPHIKLLAVMLNIDCDQRYIVIDASIAMVFAKKKIFPLCIIIMCWFHLKYNVFFYINLLLNKMERREKSKLNYKCIKSRIFVKDDRRKGF